MTEQEYTKYLIDKLGPRIARCKIKTKMSVLYNVSFNSDGFLKLGQNRSRIPTRGGGTGFEQDILLFEEVRNLKADTAIIPRVIAEVKFGRMTSHAAIVYSEKARRIRSVYPFIRFGLFLGNMDRIPLRVVRLGQEFDFIKLIKEKPSPQEIAAIKKLLQTEIRSSRYISDLLESNKNPNTIWRRFNAK